MPIEFAHARDRRYARQILAVTSRHNRILMVGVGLLLTLAGLAASSGEPGWRTICGTAAMAIGICWMIKFFIMPWQLVRRLPASWFQPRHYRVAADGVEWSSPAARTWIGWAVVGRVTTEPFAYLLWQPGGLGMWDIPRAALTPEQDRDLAALFAAHVGRAPAEAGGDARPHTATPEVEAPLSTTTTGPKMRRPTP
ncbi:hypothetical protein NCC78_10260 [Micromonospora phytophila]|uniref:hypothetical protein n=1 Tax=Micromonospora phytophila TaxID=709888 RepID=UPI0020307863|nr:hypothetical protein [Micromonospora phytophila]MCM0675070.1 hypothetical protein [Micromonospora phytophila]